MTSSHGGVTVLDVSDPAHPLKVGGESLGGGWYWNSGGYGQSRVGELLAVASGWAGVSFLDLSTPQQLQTIALYDAPEAVYDLLFHQGLFYLASGKAGLEVVDLKLPVVTIDRVGPEEVRPGEEVTLQGSVYDPAGSSWNYSWSSSLMGPLGWGPELVTTALDPGEHRLILEVVNDLGQRGQAEWTSLTVVPAPPERGEEEPEEPVGVDLDPRLALLIVTTVSASSLASLGYGLHTSGETGRYQLYAALAPLMARRKERRTSDPLAHETRGYIRGFLLANPGAHYRKLKAALKLTNGTLAHHLMIMEREGLVVSRRRGQLRCFYLLSEGVGAPPPDPEQLSPTQEHLMELVERHPGISQKDLALAMDMTAAAVKYNIDQLLARELVRRERRGMWVTYYVAPARVEHRREERYEEQGWSRFRP